jgi:hypothetical protein
MVKGSYWQNKENRRKFLDQYAKEKGFDPLLPENWYNISSSVVLQHPKVCQPIFEITSYGKLKLII